MNCFDFQLTDHELIAKLLAKADELPESSANELRITARVLERENPVGVRTVVRAQAIGQLAMVPAILADLKGRAA